MGYMKTKNGKKTQKPMQKRVNAEEMHKKPVKNEKFNLGLPDKELFRPDEIADYLRVSRSTIYMWIDHGHLKAEKFPGERSNIRISRSSVENFRKNCQLCPSV